MKRIICIFLTFLLLFGMIFSVSPPAYAAGPYLTEDEQWIAGLSDNYEYITERTYEKYGCEAANNKYWTGLGSRGGTRPDGTKYNLFSLVEGSKLQVLSAWYGETVYFRTKGSSGKGTAIEIPEYSQLKEQYKKAIRVANAYCTNTGRSFYQAYINTITDDDGYLIGAGDKEFNIDINVFTIESFNKNAEAVLTDAEGNYIYDMVAIGPNTETPEPDISGYAAHVLNDYVNEGYGFLIGHDMLYGYGGVTSESYTPDPNDKSTPYYTKGDPNAGHFNMNWLMGVNKNYKFASPYESNSLILSIGDYEDRLEYIFGNNIEGNQGELEGTSEIQVNTTINGDPQTDIDARTPVNYPFSKRTEGTDFSSGTALFAGLTHSNLQMAYGKIWLSFTENGRFRDPVEDRNAGYVGTNNFYLTTNGNIGMTQIGHLNSNLTSVKADECRILANTIFYLSQREPCLICKSEQGGHDVVHDVIRISSAEELALIGNPEYEFAYPLDGCYVLNEDIVLPEDWVPIEDFRGHFNANGQEIELTNGQPVFLQEGIRGFNNGGWNLGTDDTKGLNSVSNIFKNNTTGTARVVGTLPQLFGREIEKDYNNYKIILTDKNGLEYDCVTDREGKYVISNIAAMPQDKLYAKVYDASGKEVTEYGKIYTVIKSNAWNNNMTVPLELEDLSPLPIADQTIYEQTDVSFTAKYTGDKAAKLVQWKYIEVGPENTIIREGDISELETMVEYIHIGELEFIDGEQPFFQNTLTIFNADIDLDKYRFYAVFEIELRSGETIKLSTYDRRTDGANGELTVLPRPFEIDKVEDARVWAGDYVEFSTTLEYFKSVTSGDVNVFWAYSFDGEQWIDIQFNYMFNEAEVENSSVIIGKTQENPEDDNYLNTTTLKIPKTVVNMDGIQFKPIFTYVKYRRGLIPEGERVNYQGVLTVKDRNLYCSYNPYNLDLTGDLEGTLSGRFSYTAKFIFSADNPDIDVSWQYKDNAAGSYKDVSESPLASRLEVGESSVEEIGENLYEVTTNLYITDPNMDFNNEDVHYYFRAKAQLSEDMVAFSSAADIIVRHKIDIVPNDPTTAYDNGYKEYKYPNIEVFAPSGVSYFKVSFEEGTSAENTITANKLIDGMKALANNSGYEYESTTGTLTEDQVREIFSELVFRVKTPNVNVVWQISQEPISNGYNPFTGKVYEVISASDKSWKDAYNLAKGQYNSDYQVYGQLATINSSTENALITNLLKARGETEAWIGITNDEEYNRGNSGYYWIDGSSTKNYNNWRSGYPSGSGEQYGYITDAGVWKNAAGTFSISFPSKVLKNPDGSLLSLTKSNSGPGSYSVFMEIDSRALQNALMEDGVDLAPYVTDLSYTLDIYTTNNVNRDGNNIHYTYATDYSGYRIENRLPMRPSSGQYRMTATFELNGLKAIDVEVRQNAGSLGASSTTVTLSNITVSGKKDELNNKNAYVVEYIAEENPSSHTEISATKITNLDNSSDTTPPEPGLSNVSYRVGTDVIISCGISATRNINSDNPASVTFTITNVDGTVETRTFEDVCLPAGKTQRAYVKYNVGSNEGYMNIDVSTNGDIVSDTAQIIASVYDIAENTPPDPKGDDKAHSEFNRGSYITPPAADLTNTSHNWYTYSATKVDGRWEYQEHEHTATLYDLIKIKPDSIVPTAGTDTIKSGYGINVSVTTNVSGDMSEACVGAQTAIAYFPEFGFEDYWRILEVESLTGASSALQLKVNEYSLSGRRSHYIPVWFPDGAKYNIYVSISDAWTPVGKLSASVAAANGIWVEGDIYDDWYVKTN